MSYSPETIEAAKKLYLRRYRVPEIVKELGVPRRTVYFWINKYSWDDMLEHEGPLAAAGRRLENLMNMPDITEAHLKAIDQAVGTYERLRKVEASFSITPVARQTADIKLKEKQLADDQPDDQKPQRSRGRKNKKKVNNDFRGLTADEIEAKIFPFLFEYQVEWWEKQETGLGPDDSQESSNWCHLLFCSGSTRGWFDYRP